MVSENDIDQPLDNTTCDGNQTEKTAADIRAAVSFTTTVDAQISAAMDEWFCRLHTTPANVIPSFFSIV